MVDSSSDSEGPEVEVGDALFEDLEYEPEQAVDEDGAEMERGEQGVYPFPQGWGAYLYKLIKDQIVYFILSELFLMHPIFLSQALQCLPYLNDKTWIDTSSIDIWLMESWKVLRFRQARYIPSTFIPPIHAPDDDGDPGELEAEIDRFRELFGDLPDRGTACPLETLVYAMNCGPNKRKGGNHFCVVVFAPGMKAIYLLGRQIKTTWSNNCSSDWASWNGQQIWRRVCQLMGWTGLPAMTLRTVDWTQNGYDCGPIACQVAQHIFLKGMRTDGSGQWKRPAMLGCCHTLRLRMAELMHQVVLEGTRKYRMVRDHCHEELYARYEMGLGGMDVVHDELEEGLAKCPVEELNTTVKNLRKAIQKCERCLLMIEEDRQQ